MLDIRNDLDRIINYANLLKCEVIYMSKSTMDVIYNTDTGCYDHGNKRIILETNRPLQKQLVILAHELGHYIDYKFSNKFYSVFNLIQDELTAWSIAGELLKLFFNNKYADEFNNIFDWGMNSYINTLGYKNILNIKK